MYQAGDEVAYMYEGNQRTGHIESITGDTVSICMLDGTLLITSVDNILYKIIY